MPGDWMPGDGMPGDGMAVDSDIKSSELVFDDTPVKDHRNRPKFSPLRVSRQTIATVNLN